MKEKDDDATVVTTAKMTHAVAKNGAMMNMFCEKA
jgi:hypothetical protein